MELIFTAFANSREHPLATLQEEDEQVYTYLSKRVQQQHFGLHRDSTTTTAEITKYLSQFKEDIVLFLYSGHAGNDMLLLEDQAAQAKGISDLLGRCPNLQVVILNGCSTAGQVQQLLALKNSPVVIATSAPVEDRSATQFSIHFFQALCEQNASIRDAFESGVAAAQVVAQSEINVHRNLALEKTTTETGVWGLFYNSETATEWKLPNVSLAAEGPKAASPANDYLIAHLLEKLAAYQPEIAQMLEEEQEGLLEHSILDKREAILKRLPHPVSEQFRKLLVPEPARSNAVFFDKPGKDRLRQMVVCYYTVMELITFSMLAQLWDAISGEQKIKMPPETTAAIRDFLYQQQKDRNARDFFPLLQTIMSIFEENKIDHFIRELGEQKPLFADGSELHQACQYMETLKMNLQTEGKISQEEAILLCGTCEEKLAGILGHLCFISNYTLTSVKNIDVIKYRHFTEPKFKHKLVKLVQRFVGLAEEQKVLGNYMDSSSVLLMSTDEKQSRFLNLSPFLIDENAFDEKAAIAKLYYFVHYEKQGDALCFKHVYKPNDRPLVVQEQPQFRAIKAQFDSFAKLVFQHSLRDVA